MHPRASFANLGTKTRLAAALLLLLTGTAVSCRKNPPRVEASDIERCESGIELALKQTTAAERDHIYYGACAGVYAEPSCREAFRNAASLPDDQRLVAIGDPCRKAYCPLLEERGELAACGGSFVASDESLKRAWPPLHDAILKYDARGYAPRLSRVLLGFYTRALTWPSPSAETPSPSAGTAPSSLPGETPPTPASATPQVAASASASALPSPTASTRPEAVKAPAKTTASH